MRGLRYPNGSYTLVDPIYGMIRCVADCPCSDGVRRNARIVNEPLNAFALEAIVKVKDEKVHGLVMTAPTYMPHVREGFIFRERASYSNKLPPAFWWERKPNAVLSCLVSEVCRHVREFSEASEYDSLMCSGDSEVLSLIVKTHRKWWKDFWENTLVETGYGYERFMQDVEYRTSYRWIYHSSALMSADPDTGEEPCVLRSRR